MIDREKEACQAQRGRFRLGKDGERAREKFLFAARRIYRIVPLKAVRAWNGGTSVASGRVGELRILAPSKRARREKRLCVRNESENQPGRNTILDRDGLSPMGATAATPMTEGRTAAHTRQPDSDRRALARCAADGNGAGMFFHDLLHGRETQA
jgi:hypothetical protein